MTPPVPPATPFFFGVLPPELTGLQFHVRPGIRSKVELMDALFEDMQLPAYFGSNWDALNECLHDLEWLPPGPVILIHTDLPLADDEVSLRSYLALLAGAARNWQQGSERQFFVLFPAGAEKLVSKALEEAPPWHVE